MVVPGARVRGTGPVSWAECRSAAEALLNRAEGIRETGWVAPRDHGLRGRGFLGLCEGSWITGVAW